MTATTRAAGAVALLASGLCQADLAPGDYHLTLEHQGRGHGYIVHVLVGRTTADWPVVINFHGGGGHARPQQRYSYMDLVADREGFLAVYTNDTGPFANRLLPWNACTCCGWAQKSAVDDVEFTRALVEDLARRAQIDRARPYATGLSNGAMMSYRLAVEAPDLIAAIAQVAGSMVCLPFIAGRPIPILHVHSVDDPRVLYAGGLGPPFPFTNIRVLHPSAGAVISHWVEFDGCSKQPGVKPPLHGTDGSAKHTATFIVYAPCRGGAEGPLWRLTGLGHVWPGSKIDYIQRALGPGTADQQMWRFSSRFSLD
jgi:polyhydroxybutyrate depolymerase